MKIKESYTVNCCPPGYDPWIGPDPEVFGSEDDTADGHA